MPTRRRCLACLGAAAAGGLAGCTSLTGDGGSGGGTPTNGSATPDGNVSATGSLTIPVPKSELQRGAAKDAIPAIVDPVFAPDWSGLSMEVRGRTGPEYTARPRLSAEDQVIGVVRGGEARAYPLKVLNWHEVVNDSLGGPLLVTYCPLCGSALTARRTVDDEATVFGVSGYLFRNDLVMYDRATESLWSQVAATAIRGQKAGTTLELVPSTLTTWGEWRDAHAGTVVLRPPPESGTVASGSGVREYTKNPYTGYDDSRRIGIGGDSFEDDRLHPKTTVIGVGNGGESVAYPQPAVQDGSVVNDAVGGLPVVVAATGDGTLVAYERRVDGERLRFERADENHLRAGGSRWRLATGRAVDGSFEGTTLRQANDASPMFFFAWKDFHPETAVYGAGTPTATDT
jgi:hypothetical protein